ncbi:MAG: hypothetical protein A2W99_00445 [Bacteroidetes bacterium GWF2_33_16]|nr:MAG: hypothetical protein A2X00_03150 [Bacteroidetes bacterium GWE2_32_14]OFY08742.1 MAG: hypothetical protein A2W99_00445 [Bacteroidetes bacterium GWF2_33_16]
MELSDINFLAVIVAALSAFAIGSVWYSPLMFSKSWQNVLGLSEDDIKDANMFLIFGTSFVLMLIMAIGLSLLFLVLNPNGSTLILGLKQGLFIGVFFISTSYGVNILYQRKSFKLWAIDSGYQVLLLGLMGTIIGAWQ